VIDPAERAAVARLHRAGLLGVTGLGWFAASLYSGLELTRAVRRRAAHLTLQSAQALLFQLGSGLVLFFLLAAVWTGFLMLGGVSEVLPELPAFDPFSFEGIAVIALVLAAVVAAPIWYVWTIRQAWRAARHAAAGEVHPYPFVGQLVWDEAPRIWKWMIIEPAASGDETRAEAHADAEQSIESPQ
jgi:hypothetical protein